MLTGRHRREINPQINVQTDTETDYIDYRFESSSKSAEREIEREKESGSQHERRRVCERDFLENRHIFAFYAFYGQTTQT